MKAEEAQKIQHDLLRKLQMTAEDHEKVKEANEIIMAELKKVPNK